MKTGIPLILSRLAGLLAIVASGSVLATPIQFIHTGSGSGSINGIAFSNAAFTITENDDTTLRQSCGGSCFFIDDTVASIDIAGVGMFTFVTGTRTFINGSLVGFSRADIGGLDLFNGPNNAGLAGYDLLTSIGPVAGTGTLLQWTRSPIVTSGGVLVFADGTSDATFRAIAGISRVPEPATLLLFAIGALGFGLARRKRV